ncbi:cadherin-like beta sandwich domain-containing protein [Mucilaginibacter sp.]|uniref:cadherin-like beta sandwich domain-containing protein n=1 Tax=Mucilaginibacter sp. TaxID=1882438 RepID=UPI0025DCFE10|nr:cadherin-like beta sandwich domain-containing protein [Mucilaginibacter sp.]
MNKILTRVFYAFAVITFFAVVLPADAQVTFSNTAVETGGLYSALAKDASNNVYVIRVTAGSGGTSGEVVKYTGTTPTIIYTGLHEGDDTGPGGDLPWGLAVTSSGDVYVSTDFASSSGKIIKLKLSGGTYTPSTFQSGAYYTALAVDASNNLYATQYDGATHYAVYKYAANSADGTPGVKLYGNLKQAAGYSYPTGLAVAANGDIFVTDAFAQDPVLPTDGGHIYKLTASSSYATAVTVSTGQYATALALDAAGNLYTSENTGATSSGYKLLKYTGGTGTPFALFSPLHTNGIYYPYGIAVISSTNVYAIDGDDGVTGGSLDHLAPSTNALLTTLKLSPVSPLTVVSGPNYRDYTTTVPNSQASLKIIPTAQDPTATIKVNGATVASGAASGSIPLAVGLNVINTVVTAQDGITQKTYSITVIRTSLTNAYLSNFTISTGTLAPIFTAGTTNYTTTVPNATTQMTVTPTASDAGATITVNGVAVLSGSASGYLNLTAGANVINTVVTAPDGVTQKTYKLTVTRLPSTNAFLTTLKLSPVSPLTLVNGPDYKDYTTTVPNNQTSLKIIPTAQDPTATIKVNGVTVASGAASAAIPLAVGTNVVNTVVTAQDGITKNTYSITVTRLSLTNANLSNFSISTGTLTPAFAAGTTNYTTSVPNTTTQITVTPTASDPSATITVNGVAVISGSASGYLNLNVGTNVINTVVTAPDGVTQKTYVLTATRLPSTNALLTTLKLSPVSPLTVVSGPDYRDYTTSVPNSQTSIKIIPTAQDPTATIKVNGVTVASGAASGSISLAVGDNIVNTVVTAQDGVTQKTYSITVTRAAPGFVMQYNESAEPITSSPIAVHQNVSPNGDGKSDVLVIEGIAAHPDNKLQIISRSGALVYEAKGYDNVTKAFNGHSSTNGKLQLPGTYFYTLEYKDGNETKHKTGFIVLKY